MLWDIFILIAGLRIDNGRRQHPYRRSLGSGAPLGVSDLVVGLTIVAFGTSTPELAISVTSAIQGNTGIAVGT